MFKKVSLHNASERSSSEKKKLRCSLCKTMTNTAYYLCNSKRHIICENCQHFDLLKNSNDYLPEKEYAPTNKNELLYVNRSEIERFDLASGDHFDSVETLKITITRDEMRKTNSWNTSTPKGRNSKYLTEVASQYTNQKYNDNNSGSSLEHSHSSNERTEIKTSQKVTRPIVCPVTYCSKMVTIDSVPQHFNFDHSKVPKILLTKSKPHEIVLNYSTFSMEIKCIAIFLLDEQSCNGANSKHIESFNSLINLDKDIQILFLLATKISTIPKRLAHTKSVQKLSGRNSCSLIEDTKAKYKQSDSDDNPIGNKSYNTDGDDEEILLWLCKLNEKKSVYSITVSREDKTQGYNYIGDAVNIRNSQDGISIYNSTECLSVRKAVIDKLITIEKELKVIVSIM